MNQPVIKEIVSGVVERYQKEKNVLGIMLFGSVARGKFDEFSDIDVLVLLRKKSTIARENFMQDGLRVDIIFNTEKGATNYLKSDRNSVKRITSHMLAHGRILYQKGRVLSVLQSIAKSNLKSETKYTSGEVLMHKYSIDDFWGEVQRDAKNGGLVAFNLDSQLLIGNIMELFLKIKRRSFGQPNEMKEILRKLDKGFERLLEDFYETSNIQRKKEVLGKLVKMAYEKSGGQLPRKWVLKD